MKALKSIVIIIVLSAYPSWFCYGQATASASASATIVQGIGSSAMIEDDKSSLMNGQGIVVLNQSALEETAGRKKFFGSTYNTEIASFKIVGSATDFSITTPSTPIMLSSHKGNKKISIGAFNISPVENNATTFTHDTFAIKATLKVANTSFEDYTATNEPLEVVINFN